MSSKYDNFWQDRIESIKELCDSARKLGYSKLLRLPEIVPLGDRESWSGSAIICGRKIIGARMAHMVSFARVMTDESGQNSDEVTLRIQINEEPALRVFRMNWRAWRNTGEGKILSSLSIPQVAIIEEIIWAVCKNYSQSDLSEFTVQELAEWIKSHFPHLQPFLGDRGMKQNSARYPEKHIINLQDACYHLSVPGSFGIETTRNGMRVDPLSRISKMVYRVKTDWKQRIPNLNFRELLEKKEKPAMIDRYLVKSPPRSAAKQKAVKSYEANGNF